MTKEIYEEFYRIARDREDKDYWDYAKVLLDNARNIRDRWRNWILEELKHLNFYADFLNSSTPPGVIKDKFQQQIERLKGLDIDIREAVRGIDSFTKQVEDHQFTDNPYSIYASYKRAIHPMEELIAELHLMRASLQGIVDILQEPSAILEDRDSALV